MKIRNLTICDYDLIVRLWQKAGLSFRPRGRDRKDAIQAQIEADPDFFLGAFEDNQLVGVVVASTDGRRGWINRLAVEPNRRRRGVAKSLINEAERILRTRGIKVFCALVEDSNTASMQLFKDCGYKAHSDIVYLSKRESSRV